MRRRLSPTTSLSKISPGPALRPTLPDRLSSAEPQDHGATPEIEPAYLTAAEVGAFLRVRAKTLVNWRWRKIGPPYIKIGASVRYERNALLAWLRSGQRQP